MAAAACNRNPMEAKMANNLRPYDPFRELAREIDDEKAAAKYQDGVLDLTLPKKGGGGAKKLAVS